MTTQHDCQTLRAQLFDYRLDELSVLDRAVFEESAAHCPECHLYVHRIIEMMDLASSEDAWIEEDLSDDPNLPDRMLANISATLGLDVEPKRAPAPVIQGAFGLPLEDEEVVKPRQHTFFLSAAALLLVGFGGVIGYHLMTSSPQSITISPAPIAKKDAELPAPVPVKAPVPQESLFAKLEAKTNTPRALKVFASKEAKWRVSSTSSKKHVLNLEQGTVLVEFLPSSSESLKVITRGSTINVTGTVFYVSQPKSSKLAEVGVLTGEVKVRAVSRTSLPAQTLATGQRLTLDAPQQIESLRAEDREQSFVDLAHHETLLASRHKARAPSTRRVLKAPKGPSIDELSAQARQALMQKHYERAATLHERLLKRLGSKSKARATIRLELANLYLTHLNQRTQALKHLKRFVYDHPYDIATPSARTRLCRLLGAQSDQEPACVTP
jgi:hypothetical protein